MCLNKTISWNINTLKKYIFSQEDSIPEKDDPMSGDDDDDNDDQLAPPLIIFHELFFGGCLDHG